MQSEVSTTFQRSVENESFMFLLSSICVYICLLLTHSKFDAGIFFSLHSCCCVPFLFDLNFNERKTKRTSQTSSHPHVVTTKIVRQASRVIIIEHMTSHLRWDCVWIFHVKFLIHSNTDREEFTLWLANDRKTFLSSTETFARLHTEYSRQLQRFAMLCIGNIMIETILR